MSFSAIVSGIFAIAKAVPMIAEYIDKFYNLWMDKQIEQINDKYKIAYKKRKVILESIKRATTDDERKILSVILNDVVNNKL